jgi:hypothetical protein
MRRVRELAESETANSQLHESYGSYFRWFVLTAVAIHTILIFFVVAPRGEGFAVTKKEIIVIPLEPEYKIPPPPEEMARPARPVVSDEAIEDITIAETLLDINVPDLPAVNLGDEPTVRPFRPYTEPPRCKDNCSSDDVLGHLPTLVKKTGVTCEVVVGLHIATSGVVKTADILKSSGNQACDSAVEKWAPTTRWTTAYNRDEPVAVWIAQPVRIESE